MNRTDRLLAILLELQAHKQQRAEDLAATFEVSKRTIYRDIMALMESGVPVVSIPGQGYSLVEGFFLPPLTFTTDEAIMLLLGSDAVAPHFDAQYRSAAISASHKISVVLPPKLRDEVESLQRSIRFIVSEIDTSLTTLQQARRAIIQSRSVRFTYRTRFGDDSTGDPPMLRTVDPYALVHFERAWLIVGYDHTRKAIRNFRLDRMTGFAVLDRTFQRPADFRIGQRPEDDRKLTVRVLIDPEAAQWAREARSFFQVGETLREDGLLLTFLVRREEEITQWLLSWGSRVRILEPASLRERLRAEAEKMLTNFSNS